MLTHIVLFAFKDDVASNERAEILAALRDLGTSVPTLRSLEVGENISPARAQGHTHVLVETFADRAGLAAYTDHPAHVPVAARIRAAVSQLLAVDLET